MSADTREERLARRIADLYATDPQFAAAKPIQAIAEAIEQPGLPLAEIVRTVMEGYADRPAVGQRAIEFINDPDSGRTTAKLLPQFETITYSELWDRVGALASAMSNVRPGDRVCILGFTSVDYTVVDMATDPAQRSVGAAADQRADHATAADRHRNPTERDRLEHRLCRRRRRTGADRPRALNADRVRLPPRDRRASRGLRRRPRPADRSRQPGGCGNFGRHARTRKELARRAAAPRPTTKRWRY